MVLDSVLVKPTSKDNILILFTVDLGTVREDGPHWTSENEQDYFSDADYLEIWKGMEEAHKLGLTKSIGVSNFNSRQLDRLLKSAKIKPVVSQVECTPNLNQKKLIKFCKDRGIVVIIGYSPLGSSRKESAIFDPKVAEIAKKHNITSAQVVLMNCLVVNLGIVVIPKSVTTSRLIYDFTLTSDDLACLNSCNKNQYAYVLNGHTY